MAPCGRKSLVVMTTQCATASLATLLLSMLTNSWLHTSERREANNTLHFVNSTSGLWRRCAYTEINGTEEEKCSLIDYMAPMDRDGLGPTDAILLTMRRAAIFPVISVLILFIGQIICLVSLSRHSLKSLTLAASVLYVAAGLCTLIGIILYIGAITEEVGNLSKKRSSGEPRITYEYGVSFVLAVGSFLFSELTGVLFVYLYISKHNYDYGKKQEQRHHLVASAAGSSSASSRMLHCNSDGLLTSLTWDGRGSASNHSNNGHSSSRNNSHGGHSSSGKRQQRRHSDKSRDHSPSRSDSYTYALVSGGSGTVTRDVSNYTLSTNADVILVKDHSITSSMSTRDNADNNHRRTTQV